MATTDLRDIEQAFNDVVRQVFPEFLVRSPAYRYYHHRGQKDRFFWATEVVQRNGGPRYASGIYHFLKTKRAYKLTREQYHAKRKDAKARAWALYEAAT